MKLANSPTSAASIEKRSKAGATEAVVMEAGAHSPTIPPE